MSVNSEMTAIADLIRGLRGVSGKMGLDAMKGHLQDEQDGLDSAIAALTEKGVTVPDGTKVDGLAALIAAIEAGGGGDSDEEWFNDGDTHIWITLHEGRTSPMMGVCPNGTVTVDWGDGTEPDVLTGTSTSAVKWTPKHEYAEPGDYVINLTVDGTMSFKGDYSFNNQTYILRNSSNADARNRVYQNAIKRFEIGNSVTSIGSYAFYNCSSLSSITIPDSVTSIETNAFKSCYSLSSITIPDGVTSIGNNAFESCSSLSSITIPDGVPSIGTSAFYNCSSLSSITIPDSVTSIGNNAFESCSSLSSITIPDSVTSIGSYAFYNCSSLSSITIPDGVPSIGSYAFYNCYGTRCYDFTKHTSVPSLANTNAFKNIQDDCEIRVPAALYDEWIAATNWSTYASYIVAV